jgi:hypothetical protein
MPTGRTADLAGLQQQLATQTRTMSFSVLGAVVGLGTLAIGLSRFG